MLLKRRRLRSRSIRERLFESFSSLENTSFFSRILTQNFQHICAGSSQFHSRERGLFYNGCTISKAVSCGRTYSTIISCSDFYKSRTSYYPLIFWGWIKIIKCWIGHLLKFQVFRLGREGRCIVPRTQGHVACHYMKLVVTWIKVHVARNNTETVITWTKGQVAGNYTEHGMYTKKVHHRDWTLTKYRTKELKARQRQADTELPTEGALELNGGITARTQ